MFVCSVVCLYVSSYVLLFISGYVCFVLLSVCVSVWICCYLFVSFIVLGPVVCFGLGRSGAVVVLPVASGGDSIPVVPARQQGGGAEWKKYAHNEGASRKISLRRKLPDVRDRAYEELLCLVFTLV